MSKVMILSAPSPGLLEVRINGLLRLIYETDDTGFSNGHLYSIQYAATTNNYTALICYEDRSGIQAKYEWMEAELYESLKD
ncbi:MAG: hypothetical protein K6T83_07905 [Alicyclobacillus sp.]|nr:hypothetical protein [Alicyclobacillus sp.]